MNNAMTEIPREETVVVTSAKTRRDFSASSMMEPHSVISVLWDVEDALAIQ
jgi:hypothetical protein